MTPGKDTKIIEFLVRQSPYAAGEVAGFPKRKAEALVQAGAAKFRDDLQKGYDKTYAAKKEEENADVEYRPTRRRTVRPQET